MRPLRFLLTLVSCCLAFILLLAIGPWTHTSRLETSSQENYNSYYWHTPSSLFPPSAIISITDDNSTNFLARPAAFGPLLPSRSLSGQLWTGSGFGEDHLGRGGSGAGAQGELGCSDVPGWEDGKRYGLKKSGSDGKGPDMTLGSGHKNRRSLSEDEDEEEGVDDEEPTEHDGTDDHLHHPLLETSRPAGTGKKATHADIQSLQESAEIAGKVVLLSRGGCGFLEKVKWVQRRGGIALIVGDDIRGGPLVTMYARGDTSNVTIPSVFISHMTAQLLSSLMPSGALAGSQDDAGQIANGGNNRGNTDMDKPNFTSSTTPAKATSTSTAKVVKGGDKEDAVEIASAQRGWLSFFRGSASRHQDSRRPPSSGSNDWDRQQGSMDEKSGQKIVKSDSAVRATTQAPRKSPDDGFKIGVQDWRDPDLVAAQKEQHLKQSTSTRSVLAATTKSSAGATSTLRGGSITPGSGEYRKSKHAAVEAEKEAASEATDAAKSGIDGRSRRTHSWFARLFYSTPGQEDVPSHSSDPKIAAPESSAEKHHSSASSAHRQDTPTNKSPTHEGLWVTLSPASMSTSPFFDTLLVLVVSPLVTLTVVYALLLLRSRIRRRRWRAPKSVVERLPVRTYQTMPSTTPSSSASDISTSTTLPPMSTTTPTSPTTTTPLLQHHASQPITTRPPRPRSRTTPDLPQASSSLLSTADTLDDGGSSLTLEQIEEKRANGLAEWRRRYGGKQRECVVCLEEYVDGVSRVMSLPCGHEFHVECITPWLTTRRRTCPICKGDVVRSLARSSRSSNRNSQNAAYSYFSSSGLSTSPDNTEEEEAENHSGARADRDQEASMEEEERVLMLEEEEGEEEESTRTGGRRREDVSREREAEEDLERGERQDEGR